MARPRGSSTARTGRELERADWAGFFEQLNHRLEGGDVPEATLEITGDEVGGVEAERLPLVSVTYEEPDDEIAVGLGGRRRPRDAVLWHFIERPHNVWVDDDDDEVHAIVVRSVDGTLTELRLAPAGPP
jgi:hypothetical protein